MTHLTLPPATLSECRQYRYMLTRQWDNTKPYVVFVGLNPSTADETKDDATIRRCIGYARSWGYGGIIMVNLFAFRATDPRDMKKSADPIGPLNDFYLSRIYVYSNTVVAAWGNHGKLLGRDADIKQMYRTQEHAGIVRLCTLALTKNGNPKHPLYLPKDLSPMSWQC